MNRPRAQALLRSLPALPERRSIAVAYLLWALCLVGLPLGVPLSLCGVHRLYCRKPISGGVWLFTAGLCGVAQLVDLFLIPELVQQANQPLALAEALRAARSEGPPPLERQLLLLARSAGPEGFTLNDALIEVRLPDDADSRTVSAEIERLLHAHLLDVGNDERGRVIYREP